MNYRWRGVEVEAGSIALGGDIGCPAEPSKGLVVFAHGSGSSRKSRRNRYVAERLMEAGLSVLLFDLLTPYEEEVDRCSAEYRFDIPRLAGRLGLATDWALGLEGNEELSAGFLGASTGGAAAIMAAVHHPGTVRAVVSRGGRPDLAGACLRELTAPTLLIVGENDLPALHCHRSTYEKIRGEKALEIVPGATHLFDEPGALEKVAGFAARWFLQHLPTPELGAWQGEQSETMGRD